MADDATVGTRPWDNPDYAKASDNAYAIATDYNDIKPSYSHYLKATNFGFSIPSGATINGILVEFERWATGDTAFDYIKDSEIKIVKSDGSIGTTNKADTVTHWSTTEAYFSYGS